MWPAFASRVPSICISPLRRFATSRTCSTFSITNIEGSWPRVARQFALIRFALVSSRNLKPKEAVNALKTLGIPMTVEQCVTYIEEESRYAG